MTDGPKLQPVTLTVPDHLPDLPWAVLSRDGLYGGWQVYLTAQDQCEADNLAEDHSARTSIRHLAVPVVRQSVEGQMRRCVQVSA